MNRPASGLDQSLRASPGRTGGGLLQVAWWPLPLLAVAVVLAAWLDRGETFVSSGLLLLTNFLFLFCIPAAALAQATRAYRAGGPTSLLLLGCGLVALAYAGLVPAGLLALSGGPDAGVTAFSLAVLLAGLCKLLSVLSFFAREPVHSARRGWGGALASYAAVVLILASLTLLVLRGSMPPFYSLAEEESARRTLTGFAVLGTAAGLFALTAFLYYVLYSRSRWRFFLWYALALALMSLGLVGVVCANSLGSALSWAGRLAQYVGTLYLLAAVVSVIREMRSKGLPVSHGLAAVFSEAAVEYRALVESAPDAIVALEDDGTIRFCNPAAERLFGLRWQEVFGRHLGELLAGVDGTELRRQLAASIAALSQHEPGPRVMELEIANHHGRTIPTELSIQARRMPRGHVLVGILKDVTERKQVERWMTERSAEAERRAAQLRALAGELTLVEQQERRRLAQMLHDGLQQMLVAAKLSLEVLLRRLEDPRLREAAGGLVGLLDDSIATSRSLTMELSPPVLYDAGLGKALEWLGRWFAEKYRLEVVVRVDSDTEPPSEEMRVLLFQAVRELLFNVFKHARVDQATVSLSRTESGRLKVTVADDGQGFSPAALEAENDLQKSSGFGLFSIRERVELMGGTFAIESAPGQGTRVNLLAPLLPLPSQRKAAAKAEAAAPAGPEAVPADQRIRVLVVDDHRVLRDGLKAMLGPEADLQIVGEAGDGLEALRLAQRLRPHVILMDVTMPLMNGIEATARITQQWPQIQVVALSMHEEDDMAQAMREAGASGYLTKGGPVAEVVQAIRRAAQRALQHAPA